MCMKHGGSLISFFPVIMEFVTVIHTVVWWTGKYVLKYKETEVSDNLETVKASSIFGAKVRIKIGTVNN